MNNLPRDNMVDFSLSKMLPGWWRERAGGGLFQETCIFLKTMNLYSYSKQIWNAHALPGEVLFCYFDFSNFVLKCHDDLAGFTYFTFDTVMDIPLNNWAKGNNSVHMLRQAENRKCDLAADWTNGVKGDLFSKGICWGRESRKPSFILSQD